ncbi:MAG: Polyprenyl synthetase family protein [Cyanobacteriota bacterium erpe_2018_sw_21hr_WHONDRS-SW48-000092_B_bin.40]|jgi:geranylgeranyl diphosphate synthase type II|nr:Polyprenyl synthetase family protein [Cyanobacteriota bacterium erpe_2018_sw_21hr_WHONDRS-SW48-000092_B_bin.40]
MQLQTKSDFDFESYLLARRKLVEDRLAIYLVDQEPVRLWQSMRYSVLSGGKRLRAMLTLAAAEAIAASKAQASNNGQKNVQSKALDPIETVLPCACAIEMVHAMSLVHDDLPCLDNDDLRRGKPTNHKVYGEALALLAGDGLLMLANEILIEHTSKAVNPSDLLTVAHELCKATGPSGMVGGQVKDMEFTGADDTKFDIATVESIHAGKTGALIRFSLWSGGKLMGANENQLASLYRLGEILGLAFQITDDLLDVTGDAKTLGKTPGKDEASKKATWVRAIGVDGARQKLNEMESEGVTLIEESALDIGGAPVLKALLKYAIHRQK